MSGAAAVIDEAAAALATLASPETAKPSATYDAAEATGAGKRIRKSGRHKSEDKVLTPAKRGRMQTDAHDLRRNLAVAGWAMRMHVAHVAQHTLQVTTPDREFNRDLERLMKKRLKDPKAVDAAGRHTNDRLIWITELSATGDGDIFVNVLPDGRVQLIEGDRFAEPMRKPKGYDKDRVVHGVELDALGAAKRYCLTELKDGRREFVKWIGAESIRQHGFFDRYGQVRGVSPLAPALNPFRDMMEAQVYALALMKLEQLLGVKIMRSADDPLDGVTPAESGDGEVSGGDSGGASGADEGYAFDFTKGPAVFDLEPGDDVQMLTGVSPHTNFQAFLEAMTMAALKALDLDFCLYDSSHTNYSGSRQAGTTYDLTSRVRREELASLREWITERQLAVWVPQWVESGALQMPEGMTVEGITFEWRSVRPGWIDRLKELKTEKGAVDGLMTSKKRASMRLFGEDYDEVFEEIVQERQREKEAGLEPVVSAAVDVELDRDDEQDDDMPQRRGGAGENEEGGDA